jgi:hypothetical protein
MTVNELIEFLSAQPFGLTVKTWNPDADEYEEVTGAVFGQDGVLFLQTGSPSEAAPDMVRARREAANILLRHPPCLSEDVPMGDLIEDLATAIARPGLK